MKRNFLFDLIKIFMAYLVVVIHCTNMPNNPLTKVAVPFFFILAGFFATRQPSTPPFTTENSKHLLSAKKSIFSSIYYLIFGFTLYFIYDVIGVFINKGHIFYYVQSLVYTNPIVDIIFLNLPRTSGFHLWFLITFVECRVLHYLALKFNKTYLYKYLFLPLLAINLILTVYMRNSSVGYFFFSATTVAYTRNTILFGMPLFALGYTLKGFNFDTIKKLRFPFLIIAIFFFYMQKTEANYYLQKFNDGYAEFYISSILSCVFLILSINCFNFKENVISRNFYLIFGKNCAFYIYIIHCFISFDLKKVYEMQNGITLARKTFLLSLLLYLQVRIIIMIFSLICKKIQNRKRNHLLR